MKVKNSWKEYEDYKTEYQWNKLQKKIKKEAIGVVLWSNSYCQKSYKYYSPAEVEDMTQAEYIAFTDNIKARAKERYQEKKEARDNILKTSWQWLAKRKRYVKDNAEPLPETFCFGGTEKTFYYYRRKDTCRCFDKRYKELKELYIKNYGGWEEIDLKNTDYNGKKWY